MCNIKVDLYSVIIEQVFAFDKHMNAHLVGNPRAFGGFRRLGEEEKSGRQ